MKAEEAIEILLDNTFSIRIALAVREGIEALEKQIPKKPKHGSRAIKVGIEGANCSICGALIFKSQCYCNRCGQELDWSGENE